MNPLIAVAELASALGETPISGVWECRIDDSWYVAARGAPRDGDPPEIAIEPEHCMKVELRPFEMAVWLNGWLAGLIDPAGGQFAAGESANAETFCAAVKARSQSGVTSGPCPVEEMP